MTWLKGKYIGLEKSRLISLLISIFRKADIMHVKALRS